MIAPRRGHLHRSIGRAHAPMPILRAHVRESVEAKYYTPPLAADAINAFDAASLFTDFARL
jgi:hypothetical protein